MNMPPFELPKLSVYFSILSLFVMICLEELVVEARKHQSRNLETLALDALSAISAFEMDPNRTHSIDSTT